MSHQVETIAYAGQTPWHGLGEPVSPDLTPREMQISAGLDWKVEKVPLHYPVGKTIDGEVRWEPSGSFALVRSSDGRCLDTVKAAWKPVQNSDAFKFFDAFVRAGDLKMETAGSLSNGRMVFALAKANAAFRLERAREDVTESYLLFTNPHVYGQSVDIRFTPIRVVCHNTLTMALGQRNNEYRVGFAHRNEFCPEDAQQLVRQMMYRLEGYREQANFLASKRYNVLGLENYFREVFKPIVPPRNQLPGETPKTRNAALAMEIVEQQPGHEHAPGTWWNAFNAVTYLTDHEIGRSQETRLVTAWYGAGKTRKVRGLNLALEFAKAA